MEVIHLVFETHFCTPTNSPCAFVPHYVWKELGCLFCSQTVEKKSKNIFKTYSQKLHIWRYCTSLKAFKMGTIKYSKPRQCHWNSLNLFKLDCNTSGSAQHWTAPSCFTDLQTDTRWTSALWTWPFLNEMSTLLVLLCVHKLWVGGTTSQWDETILLDYTQRRNTAHCNKLGCPPISTSAQGLQCLIVSLLRIFNFERKEDSNLLQIIQGLEFQVPKTQKRCCLNSI